MKIKSFLLLLLITTLLSCDTKLSSQDFPIILQETPKQCGPVCLKMVSQYFGKDIALKELEELSGMQNNGTTLLGLSEAAQSIGLKNLGVKISFDQLANEVPLPAIIHWNNNHFIVVYKVNKDTIWVSDPALGKIKYTKKEFCKGWLFRKASSSNEGIALLLEKTEDF
ncbi:cysteine peptidase family C39 domain-containing protein [Aquimarina litoralis]